jgi:hypothetical protein
MAASCGGPDALRADSFSSACDPAKRAAMSEWLRRLSTRSTPVAAW